MTNHTQFEGPADVPVPPPSSLCPQCQAVEIDAKHYRREGAEEIVYACTDGHVWLVRWVVAA